MHDPTPDHAPFTFLPGNEAGGLLLLADHASNRVPPPYGDLGLAASQFDRHIAYDIGSASLTSDLQRLTGAPALLTRYSRLVIDPNRGEDDPTLVMRLSDGAIVPGNAAVDAVERERRIDRFHRPYHQAIAATIARMIAAGPVPVIVSLHSFTPVWKGVARPWDMAILWDRDARLVEPALAAFRALGLAVGDNEPYDGALRNDTLYRHASMGGLAHILIEVRQDHIATERGASVWARLIFDVLAPLCARPEMHRRQFFGSRADGNGM